MDDYKINAVNAHKKTERLIRQLDSLRKSIVTAGLNDKWLDRQFVVSLGNLRDLSNMFYCMNKVQERKRRGVIDHDTDATNS